MSVQIIFQNAEGALDNVTLDATVSESHAAEAEVTEHPVEDGTNIADHVRPKSATVRIEGVITNTPRGLSAGDKGRASAYFDTLDRLRLAGAKLTLVTPLRIYDNMVLAALDVPRDARRSNALHFTASFKQIRTAVSQTVTIKPPKAKVNRGSQPAGKDFGPPRSAMNKGRGSTGLLRLGHALTGLPDPDEDPDAVSRAIANLGTPAEPLSKVVKQEAPILKMGYR